MERKYCNQIEEDGVNFDAIIEYADVVVSREIQSLRHKLEEQEKEKHMNTFIEEEWENNNIDKWYYIYCYENKTIVPAYKICYKTNTSYFRTKEEALDFIEKYEWQIKHELGVK